MIQYQKSFIGLLLLFTLVIFLVACLGYGRKKDNGYGLIVLLRGLIALLIILTI